MALSDEDGTQSDQKSEIDPAYIYKFDQETFVREMAGFIPGNAFDRKLTQGILLRNGIKISVGKRSNQTYDDESESDLSKFESSES